MKEFCLSVVIDIETGYALACGVKYKDFENKQIRYINTGSFRTGFLRRKITMYFRTLTIKGRDCVIVYWSNERKKPVNSFAYPFNNNYFLRAKQYFLTPCDYSYLIENLGFVI